MELNRSRTQKNNRSNYQHKKPAPGKQPTKNTQNRNQKEAHKKWDMLPEYLRDKNRDQADHFPIKSKILLNIYRIKGVKIFYPIFLSWFSYPVILQIYEEILLTEVLYSQALMSRQS